MRLIIAAIVIASLFLIYHPDATLMALYILISAVVRFLTLGGYYLILALAAFPAIKVVRKAWRS